MKEVCGLWEGLSSLSCQAGKILPGAKHIFLLIQLSNYLAVEDLQELRDDYVSKDLETICCVFNRSHLSLAQLYKTTHSVHSFLFKDFIYV